MAGKRIENENERRTAFTITLKNSDKKKIREYAEKNNITMTEIVESLLKRWEVI